MSNRQLPLFRLAATKELLADPAAASNDLVLHLCGDGWYWHQSSVVRLGDNHSSRVGD